MHERLRRAIVGLVAAGLVTACSGPTTGQVIVELSIEGDGRVAGPDGWDCGGPTLACPALSSDRPVTLSAQAAAGRIFVGFGEFDGDAGLVPLTPSGTLVVDPPSSGVVRRRLRAFFARPPAPTPGGSDRDAGLDGSAERDATVIVEPERGERTDASSDSDAPACRIPTRLGERNGCRTNADCRPGENCWIHVVMPQQVWLSSECRQSDPFDPPGRDGSRNFYRACDESCRCDPGRCKTAASMQAADLGLGFCDRS
jgi:hypothetical protein